MGGYTLGHPEMGCPSRERRQCLQVRPEGAGAVLSRSTKRGNSSSRCDAALALRGVCFDLFGVVGSVSNRGVGGGRSAGRRRNIVFRASSVWQIIADSSGSGSVLTPPQEKSFGRIYALGKRRDSVQTPSSWEHGQRDGHGPIKTLASQYAIAKLVIGSGRPVDRGSRLVTGCDCDIILGGTLWSLKPLCSLLAWPVLLRPRSIALSLSLPWVLGYGKGLSTQAAQERAATSRTNAAAPGRQEAQTSCSY